MKNKYQKLIVILGLVICSCSYSLAEETDTEKLKTQINKEKSSIKKKYRHVEDQICETIEGKMKCVGKKMKHKINNVTDSISDKSNELKDKVD